MIRATFLAITAPLLLAPLASAHHNDSYSFGSQHNPYPATVKSGCESAREDRQLAGGLLGAVAGGVIGVALANDNDDDDYYRHRRYRDNRGYGGYRGYRGHRHNNDDDEIAGAVIGGVLGAAIGAGIAGSTTDCATVSNRPYDPAYQPTRSPTGPAWEPVSHTNQNPDLYGGTQQPREIYTPECTNVQRETRLPDGGMVRESVQACRDQNGRWTLSDGAPLY